MRGNRTPEQHFYITNIFTLCWRNGTFTESTCTIACWNACNYEAINVFYFSQPMLLSLRK